MEKKSKLSNNFLCYRILLSPALWNNRIQKIRKITEILELHSTDLLEILELHNTDLLEILELHSTDLLEILELHSADLLEIMFSELGGFELDTHNLNHLTSISIVSTFNLRIIA